MIILRSSLLLLSSLVVSLGVKASGPSWTIFHSWDGGQEYTRRGELQWSEEEEALVVANDESALTKENVQAMMDYGWYHVKIENPSDPNDFVLSTVPACNLRRAKFKDEFQITLPRTAESQITSLAYLPLVSPLAPKTCDELTEVESPAFTSKTSVSLDAPGMIMKAVLPQSKPPPGMAFLPHPNNNKGPGAAGGAGPGPTGDQEETTGQSFLRKYWYVILPLVIANFMGSPEEPAPAGAGGQEGGEPAPASVAAAPAPASSSAGKQRRGKRN
eukprot:scaffold8505_cov130-Cylindrotheca_fusiformis.AAC.2